MTYAQLKRDIKNYNLITECIYWLGEPVDENTPDRIKGKRKLSKAWTKKIGFERADGKISELWIDRAKLVEYTGDKLIIYNPGYRMPTPEERRILSEWEDITATEEFKRDEKTDVYTDSSITYWKKVSFFEKRNANYLRGFDEEHGAKLDIQKYANGDPAYIRDKNIRGDIMNVYMIERADD